MDVSNRYSDFKPDDIHYDTTYVNDEYPLKQTFLREIKKSVYNEIISKIKYVTCVDIRILSISCNRKVVSLKGITLSIELKCTYICNVEYKKFNEYKIINIFI